MSRKYNILYVDDEISNLKIFKNTFRRDYNIFIAETAEEGLQILEKEKIDLILTDQRMPEMSGVEFLKKVIVRYPQPYRILITAYTDFDALKDAVNEAKIFQYIQKPWEEKKIQQIIKNALEIYHLKQQNIELTSKLDNQNKELIRLNDELVELDKLKIQFLNIISHEIRTPLNGLMNASELLKSKLYESDYLEYNQLFRILDESANRLQHFLFLAERITAFKVNSHQVKLSEVDLAAAVRQTIESLNDKISQKNIDINYEYSTKANNKSYADEYLLIICLKEILDNAIKYSDKGGKIMINISSKGNRKLIEIRDEGPGFPEIVLKNLFKTFITDSDITKQGLGLDLGMVYLIIKAHNGNLDIKNNDPIGATVSLLI